MGLFRVFPVDMAMTSGFILHQLLPWVLSALTIAINWLAGSKWRHVWLLGLVNQFLWLVWVVGTATWGLLPLNLMLWLVYFRNHYRWKSQKTENIS